MKILLISALYAPHLRGGAEVVATAAAEGLAAAGHEVHVLTVGRKRQVEKLRGVTVHRFAPANIFSFLDISKKSWPVRLVWHLLDTFNFSSARATRGLIAAIGPDAVLTHNLKGIGYTIPQAVKKSGVRHVHTLHDVQLVKPSGQLPGRDAAGRGGVYAAVCRRLFGSPDVVVAPSQWLLDFYSARGFFEGSEKAVLRNPVLPAEGQPVAREPGGPLDLLFVGGVDGYKGAPWLVRSLLGYDGDFRLTVVGDGAAMDEVRHLTAGDSRFALAGRLPYAELAARYAAADFTVVPSLVLENSPTVVTDSLAAGTPAIVARSGGAAELIEDGVNGLTFEPGDADGFRATLQRARAVDLEKFSRSARASTETLVTGKYVERLVSLAGR